MSDSKDGTTTYRDAGVDLDAADEAIDGYRDAVESTRTSGVLDAIGGFGGLFALQDADLGGETLEDPVLAASTDGVGTKLRIAFRMERHDTIGVDCVAMCVNDIVTTGARPLFFLDYLSTGTLDPGQAEAVVEGMARGCRASGCALLGGETAEMPGFYPEGEYDIAGFTLGVAPRDRLVRPERAEAGDALVGLASNGVHSNGFSLVRKVLRDNDVELDRTVEAVDPERTIGEVLLEPTELYVRPVLAALAEFDIRGLAHVTGGGLPGNLPRALPGGLAPEVDRSVWRTPPVIDYIRDLGNIPEEECFRVFNMGIGFALVVEAERAEDVVEFFDSRGRAATRIGTVSRASRTGK